MKTAAIIVNHNNRDDLQRLLTRIRTYEIFDAVVVVDNQSDDVEWIEDIAADSVLSFGGKIHLIRADKNGGYGYGNNIGMLWAHSNGYTHAVIANPDTEFTEECIKTLLKEFENNASDAQVAVVSPICVTPESEYEAPQTAWCLKSWGQELLSKGPVCRRIFSSYVAAPDVDIVDALADKSKRAAKSTETSHSAAPIINKRSAVPTSNKEATKPEKTSVIESTGVSINVDAVLGSLLAIDVEKFHEVGGYDEDVFLYCEENILGQKMKSHGYKTRLLINQEYIHNHKPSKPSIQAVENLIASELIYFDKYLHISGIRMLISQLFFDIVRMEVYVSARKQTSGKNTNAD